MLHPRHPLRLSRSQCAVRCTARPDDLAAITRSEAIDAELKADRLAQRSQVKLLLLGAGESGKSTVLKQMKLIHHGPYSPAERESYKEVIFSNTVQSIKVLLEAMQVLQLPLSQATSVPAAQLVLAAPDEMSSPQMPPDLAAAIGMLWADSGVRACYARSREFQLNDSAPYYFDAIARLGSSHYIPTDQDVLRSRIKTTGITETPFQIGRLAYRIVDVGGQRTERKKWIHCFEGVTALIFLVAVSEYDQMLYEDASVNRMSEALTLFESICNSRWFNRSSILLFLNKTDIFRAKLRTSPLGNYFADYNGPPSYGPAIEFLEAKFLALNQNKSKTIYPHTTCATDTKQIKFVMSAVNDIIVAANMSSVGLL